MKTIYLDNSATTKPSAAVIAAMTDALENGWYNPSALYRPAMDAEKAVENAREICLKAAGAANQRMVFTSGGTEADNIAILGHLRTKHKPGRVLMLSVEHPAVLNCAQEAERMGHKVVPIPVDRRGVVDLPALEGLLGEDVHLIMLMQVNNEVGAVQPIAEVAALCAPHILSVSLSPVRSQTMLFALEGDGIYVSAGSACAAHKQKVSGVLTAMGLSPAEADCTLRFSLCPDNTEAEMDDVAQCVKKHYDLLKAYVRR